MSRKLRMLLLGAVIAVLGLAGASIATATSEHYCQGANVGINHACAGVNAHTPQQLYVEVIVDNTGCAAVEQGYAGDYAYPGTATVIVACTSGSGTNGGNTGGGAPVHGAALDQSISPYIHVYDAHMSW